jgi:MFS transporter, OFA family, oxalate/formate antiporter
MKNSPTTTPAAPARLPWRGSRPFYGWIIVGVGFVTQFFQGMANQGFPTYLPSLQKEFGWSKATLAAPRSVTQVQNSILGPIEGFLVDKIGPRYMVMIGVFVLGLGMILFGLTHNLFMYYLSNILIAAGTGFQGLLVMSVAINNWFRRKRTMAQAWMLQGFAMAGVVAVPVLAALQSGPGWRTASIASGIFIWILGIPMSMLLRTKPEPFGLLPDGATPGAAETAAAGGRKVHAEYDFSLREAIKTRTFWLLSIGWAIGNMAMGVAQTHIFLHLEQDVRLTHATASMVWMVASTACIPSRFIGGYLGDRLPKNLLLGCATTLMAASVFILAIAGTLSAALIFAVIYGVGWGIRTPVMNALQADYFGRKALGNIVGWLQSLSIPITIAAPIVVGHVADVQGTYRAGFIAVSLISLIGTSTIFLARPPKPRTA